MAVDVEALGQFTFARQASFCAEAARRDLSGEDLLDLPPHGNARAPFKLCAWRSGVVRCHGAVIPFSSNIRCDVHCSAQAVMEI
jgi:hypothetical protein